MPTLIDGYNLVHAAGILSRNIGPGTLQRARDGLIGFLKASMDEAERAGTTVVFDAQAAPADLPTEQICDGLRVLYALGYPTADALIEELIRTDSAPRRLVVVSSDQQIRRAAKRRRATAVESEPWYDDLRRRRRESLVSKADPTEKPESSTEAEVEYWLKEFDDESEG